MPQTNTESWDTGFDQLGSCGNGVIARSRITWTIGEEHAIWIQCQDDVRGRLRRDHCHSAIALSNHAKNVALDPEIVGDNVERFFKSCGLVAAFPLPDTFAPFIGLLDAYFLRQVHALETRESARFFQSTGCAELLKGIARQQTTIQRPLVAQESRQTARVDVRDRDNIVRTQKVFEGLLVTPVAGHSGQIANHQPGSPDIVRFVVFISSAGVANMGIRQCDDLSCVGRISENFLIAGHGRVEHDFPARNTVSPDSAAAKNTAIFQCQYG